MKYILYTLVAFSIISCTQVDVNVDTFLACEQIKDNYKNYDGEAISCEFHYVQTEYEGEQYIELLAHCADLNRPFVINSDCEDICEFDFSEEDSPCSKYLKGREIKDIVLIAK